MKRLIEFTLDDGTSLVVEVDEPELGGLVPASRSDEVIAKAQVSFEEALDKIKPAANGIIKKLRGLSDQPDEINVEFGLKLSAEVGAVVAAAGVEANYKVILKWKKEEKDKGG